MPQTVAVLCSEFSSFHTLYENVYSSVLLGMKVALCLKACGKVVKCWPIHSAFFITL